MSNSSVFIKAVSYVLLALLINNISAQIWEQTLFIEASQAKRLIEEQTKLKVDRIEELVGGVDNTVFQINDQFIFRFPRRQLAIGHLENELALLPYITKKVAISMPKPLFVGKVSDSYPAPFAGYVKLPGSPLDSFEPQLIDKKDFVEKLANCLKQLHTTSVLVEHTKSAKDATYQFDAQSVASQFEKIRSVIDGYEKEFIQSGFNKETLKQAVDSIVPTSIIGENRSHYIHADLHSSHLLVDDKFNLAGIIDWGGVQVGNPELDLAVAYLILSKEMISHFFETYGATQKQKDMALFRAFYMAIRHLPYYCMKNKEPQKQWMKIALSRIIAEIKESSVKC